MRTESLLAGLAVVVVGAALVKRNKAISGERTRVPRGPGGIEGATPEVQPEPREEEMEMRG